MKIDEILSRATAEPVTHQASATHFMNGSIEPDWDKQAFRFHIDPNNRLSYLLIKKTDLLGEVYQWTKEEVAAAGFPGVTMYRISVRHGTEVQDVVVTNAKIGESLSSHTSLGTAARGECQHTTGCATGCCTTGQGGRCWCDKCCISAQEKAA
jgi:hypothetical protein